MLQLNIFGSHPVLTHGRFAAGRRSIVIKIIPQILPRWFECLHSFFQDFTAFLSHSLLATVSLLDQNQLARLLSCPETQQI